MNYIIVYLEIEHLLNFLSQEEKGDFLDLLIRYAKKQELQQIENPKLLNVFNFMKGRLDTQFEKARIKAETARKNGATGGRPPKSKRNPKKPKETQSDIESQFEEFWNLYDHKKSKPKALAAFKASLKKESYENIKRGVESYIKARSPDKQFWKHPTTWLNGECWNDEYSVNKPSDSKNNFNSKGDNLVNFCVSLNNLIGHTLLTSISVSASNKAVLQFNGKESFDKWGTLSQELKDKIKADITKTLNTNGFEPKY